MKMTSLSIIMLLAVSCASKTQLAPAPTATRVASPPEAAAVAKREGVRLVADPAWPGDDSVRKHVTPMRVSIDNDLTEAVFIRYRDFRIVSHNAKAYSSLPPFYVEIGAPERVVAAPERRVVTAPEFEHKNFFIAPVYATLYPGLMSTRQHANLLDTGYHARYYRVWKEIDEDLPTPDMQKRALPEGLLEPGGRVSGFLFFQKVDPDDGQVALVFEVVRARDGEVLDRISIPYQVSD